MRIKNKFYQLSIAAIATMLHCSSVYAESKDNYRLVWADEFNIDGKLNKEDWNYEKGFVRNQEPQWYQEDNAVCKDGCLVITARNEKVKNTSYEAGSKDWRKNQEFAQYSSSSVTTALKHEILYGRMEVRAKIPTASGAWPAIWCLGNKQKSGAWPACGEIDILEFYTKSILANVAWSDSVGNSKWNTKQIPFTHFTERDKKWSEKFHVWRMDWDEESIKLYLDDELLNTTPLSRTQQKTGGYCKVSDPFKQPLFIILNLALRKTDNIDQKALPMKYYIDYVRFYQK